MAQQTSAYNQFVSFLESLGIHVGSEIMAVIHSAVKQGIGPDQIDLIQNQLEQTKAWKARFPGMAQRVANGYNAISVADYLSAEDAYHQVLASAGLPSGFYDQHQDFAKFIANDVSPTELQNRVTIAGQVVDQVDPATRNLLSQFYGVGKGDLTAYFLDPTRALPTLERQYTAAGIASFAQRNGLAVHNAAFYEGLADAGYTAQDAMQAYPTVAQYTKTFSPLAKDYGLTYNQTSAENDVFYGQSQVRQKLTEWEQAAFSGHSSGATGAADRGY